MMEWRNQEWGGETSNGMGKPVMNWISHKFSGETSNGVEKPLMEWGNQ